MHVDPPGQTTASEDRPTISCLMPTRQRLSMAKRAIDCFAAQDYDRRELVILSDGHQDYDALQEYASRMCADRLVMACVPEGSMPLGCLRNRTIEMARGDVICQWDDDDLSHPRRLSMQYEQMRRERAEVCFMTDQLLLITGTRSLYWCDWAQSRGRPLPRPTIPNTLMCEKRVAPTYVESGPLSRRSGDAYVTRSLSKTSSVTQLRGAGWLYVYVSHGGNIWAESHHLNIVHSTGMTEVDLLRRQDELCRAIAPYRLGPDIVVRDYRGMPVFALAWANSVEVRDVQETP